MIIWDDAEIHLDSPEPQIKYREKTVTLDRDVALIKRIGVSLPYPHEAPPVYGRFYVDGRLIREYDNYHYPRYEYNISFFIPKGTHTFRIEAEKDSSPRSAWCYFTLELPEGEIPPPPPPTKGILECHAYANGVEVNASVEIEGIGTYTTPFTIELDEGVYTLVATYAGQTQVDKVWVVAGQTARSEFRFIAPSTPPPEEQPPTPPPEEAPPITVNWIPIATIGVAVGILAGCLLLGK